MQKKAVAPDSKKTRVYEYLKKHILSNQLKPLEPINESSLAKELRVSKTPVREALQHLEKDGLVNNIPKKGCFVSELKIKDIRELFEVRELIECPAARVAAKKDDNERFLGLKKQLELSEAVNGRSAAAVLKGGELIHVYILESLDNRRVLEIYQSLMEHHSRIRLYFVNKFDQDRVDQSIQEHKMLLDAIINHNSDQAEEFMRIHLKNALEHIKKLSIDF